jgi:hypothetical protein
MSDDEEYEGSGGPTRVAYVRVTGGERLKARLAEIADRLSKARSVRVGFLDDARYPDGTPVAEVAAINEFGNPSKGQPPRPFFRDMIRERGKDWPEGIARALKDADYDAEAALDVTGAAIKGQLQQQISSYVGPPLKESTVKRKGFDKQLVDTGVMLNSVDYAVIKKD